ncbi:MAG: chorismate mutase [Candidatus Saganbacteria bacterium]|nr:chorismate mutase [Candidatus Saganbacteria bacterium]
MTTRGIRGAITVSKNDRDEILSATKELLLKIRADNFLDLPDIAAVIFTVTQDLDAEFPAVAARELGWNDTPLLCNLEIAVPGSLARCIRVLLLVDSDKPQKDIKHIYLREAVNLRR